MIQSTKGKLASNAIKGKFGKGFPSNLVNRATLGADQRAMAHLLCLDAERPRRCRDCGLPLRGYADELA